MKELEKISKVESFYSLTGVYRSKITRIIEGTAKDFFDVKYLEQYKIKEDKPMIQITFEIENKILKKAFTISNKSQLVLFQDANIGDVYIINFFSGKILSAIKEAKEV